MTLQQLLYFRTAASLGLVQRRRPRAALHPARGLRAGSPARARARRHALRARRPRPDAHQRGPGVPRPRRARRRGHRRRAGLGRAPRSRHARPRRDDGRLPQRALLRHRRPGRALLRRRPRRAPAAAGPELGRRRDRGPRGELEAGLVVLPVDDRQLDVRPLFRDEVLVVSADPARTRRRMSIARLARGAADPLRRQPRLRRPDPPPVRRRAPRRPASRSTPRIEVEHVETALQLVAPRPRRHDRRARGHADDAVSRPELERGRTHRADPRLVRPHHPPRRARCRPGRWRWSTWSTTGRRRVAARSEAR